MISGENPNISRSAWGGFVALRSGVRGGKGTSQPNLTIPPKIPARTPTKAAAYRIGHGFERYSDLFFHRVKGVHDVSYSLRVIECVVRRLLYGSATRKSIEHHIKPQKP